MLVLWTDSRRVLPSPTRKAITAAAAVVVVAIGLWRRPSVEQLGLRPTSPFAGLAQIAAFTGGCLALLLIAGWSLGTLGQAERFGLFVWRNWPQQGLQQVMLQSLLVPLIAEATGWRERPTQAAGAAVFSALHAPNPGLMGLTLLAGLFWCGWFARHRSLVALWLSHFVLAAAAFWCLGPVLGRMRVGAGYLFLSPA